MSGGTLSGNLTVGTAGNTRGILNTNGDFYSYYSAETSPRVQLGRDIGVSGGAGIAFGGGSYALLGTNDTSGTSFYIKLATTIGTVTTSPSFSFLSSGFYVGSNLALHAGNYNSYAPTLTGTGASGSWGISISGNAATATNISNTGTVTLATATESNSIYITAPSYSTDTPVKLLNFDWYSNVWSMGNIRSGATPSNGFGFYYTSSGGSRTEVMRLYTGNYAQAVNSFRAPIFYDSDNPAYYCDPNGTSNFVGLTVANQISGSVSGYSNYVRWQGRQSAEINRDAYYGGVYTFSTFTSTNNGGNPPTTYAEILAWGGGSNGSIQIAGDWISTTNTPLYVRSLRDCCQNWSSWTAIATSGVSFTNSVDLRAPIFYDSDNAGYYVDPNGNSNLSRVYTDNWFYSTGATGWYNSTYGGGIYMSDADWVRVAYKGLLLDAGIKSQSNGGYELAFTAANAGIGTTNQSIIRFHKTGTPTAFGTIYGGMIDWIQTKGDGSATTTGQIYARNILFTGINNTIANGWVYLQSNAVNTSGVEFPGVRVGLLSNYSTSGSFQISGYDFGVSVDNTWYTMRPTYIRPDTDNYASLGQSSLRWTVVYATTGTINTSDRTQKDNIRDLETVEKAVAVRIKSLFKAYQFKDAIQKKGDGARIHVGVVAQDVRDAFIAEGLDPARYALFCSDTFKVVNDVPVDPDEVTNEYPADAVDKTVLGVRYDELLAFVISAI